MYPIIILQEEINCIIPNTRVCLSPDLTHIILANSDFDDSVTINTNTLELASTSEPTYFHSIIKENLTDIIRIYHELTINIFPYLAKHFDFICKETLETNMFQLKYNDHTSCMVKLLPESPYMKVSAIHSTNYENLKDFDHQLNMLNITFERNRRWQSSTFNEEKKIRIIKNHPIVDRIETDTIKDNVKDTIKSIMDFNKKVQSHFEKQLNTQPCDLYHFLISTDELTIDTVKFINSKLSLNQKEISDKISNILNSHTGLSLLSEKLKKEIIQFIEEYSERDEHSNTIKEMLNNSTYTDE